MGAVLATLIFALQEDDADAHARRGAALAAERRWAEAAEEYRLAIEASPRYRSLALNRSAALLEAGEVPAALESLDAAQEAATDEYRPYVDLLRGDALSRLGRRDEAREAYGRVAASGHPEHAPAARLRLAELDAMEGRYDAASTRLGAAPPESRRIADAARQTQERLRALEAGEKPWWATLEAGIEYDTNVVFLNDDDPLADQISSSGDLRFLYGLSGGVMIHRSDDWMFGWEAALHGTRHVSKTDFDMLAASTGPFVSHRAGPVRLTLRAPFTYVWLDGEPYQHDLAPQLSAGLEPDGLPPWAEFLASYLTVTVAYRDREFLVDTSEMPWVDRTGESTGLSLSRDFPVAESIHGVVTVGGGFSGNGTRGSDFDSRSWEVFAQWSSDFVEQTSILARVSYGREEFVHHNSLAEPPFSERRRDDRISTYLELRRPIADTIDARLYWQYTDNGSTIELHQWDQHILGGGVEIRF